VSPLNQLRGSTLLGLPRCPRAQVQCNAKQARDNCLMLRFSKDEHECAQGFCAGFATGLQAARMTHASACDQRTHATLTLRSWSSVSRSILRRTHTTSPVTDSRRSPSGAYSFSSSWGCGPDRLHAPRSLG
jgi:hypothetical protein